MGEGTASFPFKRRFTPGMNNSISDVSGVSVGHVTLDDGPIQTGVTAILPHRGDLFSEKPAAACHVINGFGKSTGLLQIREMGAVETPIILTNTLSVGTAYSGIVRHMLERNGRIGRETGTVNPIVCECNDGYLNDIRALSVTEEHVEEALARASGAEGKTFARGAVGAGRGMSCYQLKGGIGTASRAIPLPEGAYTLGALVLTNFGLYEDFLWDGKPLAESVSAPPPIPWKDMGSVIVVLAIDAPLSDRQLGRLSRRAVSGLARTGAYIASGSGEIVLAFSTGRKVPHEPPREPPPERTVHEDRLDDFFLASTEAVEEAVLDSLLSAETVTGRDGHVRYALRDLLEKRISEAADDVN